MLSSLSFIVLLSATMRILRKLLQLIDAKVHRRTPRLFQKFAYGAGSDGDITPSANSPRTVTSINEGAHHGKYKTDRNQRSQPMTLSYSSIFIIFEFVSGERCKFVHAPASASTPALRTPAKGQSSPPVPLDSQVPLAPIYITDPVTQIHYPSPGTPTSPRAYNKEDARSYLNRIMRDPRILHPQMLLKMKETEEDGVPSYFAICDAVFRGRE
jgi:hypothetical protein